jgi:hypothetical protein
MKTQTPPQFFLDMTETGNLQELRACWEAARLGDNVRDDYMLINIDPPILGQKYGLGDKDIHFVILGTRLEGSTLYPIAKWPVFVYVIRILDEAILSVKKFRVNQVEMIAWGILYQTREDAESALALK